MYLKKKKVHAGHAGFIESLMQFFFLFFNHKGQESPKAAELQSA